ncbi:kinase-like domain-containing protein [Mycotypha africana]|uniref:kinase-like domain-containing protein n=1 Tax=Mycotypha africana TaxID=64632 RepID=UPI002300527B|nr:kinase-like domain-containing protein [Mycotypha africana]KAI8970338.1 kinase-like domain-containing protein [Mycotypha africana]
MTDYLPQPQPQPHEMHANPSTTISRASSARSYRDVPKPIVKTIGNYTMQQSIGKGSMGKVKLAVHNITGEKIAVKIVPRANLQILNQPAYANGKSIQQIAKEKAREENREIRTIREAHIMMLLKHPNIVGMKDLIAQGPYFYILMDFVNGTQLLHYIVKRQRLSDRRTKSFTRQIVSALDYLHRNSIVHRDLKIENIMIDRSGRHIKIIDFGLSNLFCPERLLTTYCGSLYFAAPELLKATPYSGPEVDIWSLGVVIYVMATGSVPFDDKSMPGLHEKIKRGHVDYPAHLTEECKDLLSRIFITDPAKRIIMADIIHHPWLTKDAAPINNHMPIRKPLSLPLNTKVIERMSQGFNLGTPEEIERRLTLIIQSPVYHDAMKHIADCHARKSLTPPLSNNEVNFGIVYDDPQSVPAAYHPFLSLYYLASEKLMAIEIEAHQHRLSMRSSLSRKASIDSLGAASSALSSQTSLVDLGAAGARLLTDIPLSQTPVKTTRHADEGLSGLHSASISSTSYLNRIQRWLRSSLSQHRLSTHEHTNSHMSAPPSPPHSNEDRKHAEVDPIYTANTTPATRLPTPTHSTEDKYNRHNSQNLNNEQQQYQHYETQQYHQQQNQKRLSGTTGTTPSGSKSLFRKLSQVFLKKSSTKSLHKKASNLSTSNTISDQSTHESEAEAINQAASKQAALQSNERKAADNDTSPPPVPPKDYNYAMVRHSRIINQNNVGNIHSTISRKSQQLPPGMSIATITSRQTAHTIDISTLHKAGYYNAANSTVNNNTSNMTRTNVSNSHTNSTASAFATPIANRMARYEEHPRQANPSALLTKELPNLPTTTTVTRSASLTSSVPPRHQYASGRRGSVSKMMTDKMGSWVNRSSSFNNHHHNHGRPTDINP